MAGPTLVQQASAASAAASPTSITPTLGQASTAGNLLLLVVGVTGTSPTITTPANWTLICGSFPAGLSYSIYALSKNPGGITSVAVTVGGTGGGAVASLFEFSGLGNYGLDAFVTGGNAGATAYSTAMPATLSIGELLFHAVVFAAATLTGTMSNEWSAAIGTTVSTNGVPNAQIACYWGLSPDGHLPVASGNFSASVANARGVVTYVIAGTQQTTQTPIGGVSGQYVGQFNQGMVGG